ncbi:MAG TPA: bile acid:sodium symporter family protein [Nitrospirota bacterium]|nr:bile acid:sodium symporter family protein [Nitrospirota bacterium]
MQKANVWISQRIFYFVVLALVAGCFIPLTPTLALRNLSIALFSYMTFATALATSFNEFLKVSQNPKIPLYILTVVHIVIPIVAWVIGILFFPHHQMIRIGYLISATIPVGITSVVWTALVKGNIPVSLVTVTMDTIAAPILLPLFILLVAGVAIKINYTSMIIDLLLMITLPSITGMLLYDLTRGGTKPFAEGIGGVLSRTAFFGIIFLNATFVSSSIVWNHLFLKILLVTSLVTAIGYVVGYVAGKAIHCDHTTMLSVIYNTGMRNIATGLVVATSYFPPETAIPIALAMLFQQPFAAITAKLYNWRFPHYSDG